MFFFSSRRRHTRWNCDWSSDVCSSDLREISVGFKDFAQELPLLAWIYDEPMGEPPAIPTYFMCREAKKHVSVMLCGEGAEDRKSTRLNSSHSSISYAVFCLKKKKQK